MLKKIFLVVLFLVLMLAYKVLTLTNDDVIEEVHLDDLINNEFAQNNLLDKDPNDEDFNPLHSGRVPMNDLVSKNADPISCF